MKKTFVLAIVTIFLLAACSAQPQATAPVNGLNPTSAPPQVTVPGPNPTAEQPQATLIQPTLTVDLQSAPSLSPDEVYQAVSDAWAKLGTAGPRHLSQTSSEGLNTEADSVPPDFHQVVSLGGNIVAEQYIVGGTIYNYTEGAWTQMAGGGAALTTMGNLFVNPSDSMLYSDGVVVGVELINGSPANVYSYKTTLKGLDASAQYKLLVDQISGLPVRSVNISPDGTTLDQTITYYNNITITLPEAAENAPAATE